MGENDRLDSRLEGRVVIDSAIDPRDAERVKQWYAGSDFQPRDYEDGVPAPVARLMDLLVSTAPKTVLEFGCNAGRNLAQIAERLPGANMLGIDVNESSIDWGRSRWPHLDLRHGDEAALADFADDAFELSFTVSVLDHFPSLDVIAPELVRVTSGYIVLAEVSTHVTGKAIRMADSAGKMIDAAPFAYFHDYDAVFQANLACRAVAEFSCPGPRGHLLEFYRVFVYTKARDDLLIDRVSLTPLA